MRTRNEKLEANQSGPRRDGDPIRRPRWEASLEAPLRAGVEVQLGDALQVESVAMSVKPTDRHRIPFHLDPGALGEPLRIRASQRRHQILQMQ